MTALSTSGQAQAEFYAAFERCDLEAMMAVWCEDGHIMCIHPHGPRLVGWQEIRDGWRQIMANSPSMRFRIDELSAIESEDLVVRFVNENIYVADADEPEFTVMATNVYRRTAGGWRMVLHHASPSPATLRHAADDAPAGEDEAEGKATIH